MTTARRNCAGITDRRSGEEARCDLAAWIAKWGQMGHVLSEARRMVEEIIEELLIFVKELALGCPAPIERICRMH